MGSNSPDKQVEEIKEKYNSTKDSKPVNQHDKKDVYHSYRSLAKEYGVSYPMIRHIIKGNSRDDTEYKLTNKKLK